MRLIESKITAWCAMLLAVVLVVLTFLLHTPWYGFISEFLLFLGVFAHLASLYIKRMSMAAAAKLETIALVLVSLAVLCFIGEYVAFFFLTD